MECKDENGRPTRRGGRASADSAHHQPTERGSSLRTDRPLAVVRSSACAHRIIPSSRTTGPPALALGICGSRRLASKSCRRSAAMSARGDRSYDGRSVRHDHDAIADAGRLHRVSARSSARSTALLMSDEECAVALGISVRKFHQLRSERWFPAPIALGPRLLRWSRSELESAIADMPRQERPTAEPAQLLRARIDRAKNSGR